MSHKPAYIVIDTNVLVSAGLLPQSTTAQALAVAVTHFVIAQASISRDKTDDKFLALALAMDAGATWVISGDLDLKEVQSYKGVEVVSPAQFLDRMQAHTDPHT